MARFTIDSSAAEAMLDDIASRAGQLDSVLEREAETARQTVTGIPVDTGQLARSVQVRLTQDGAEIVATAPYARFVFRGTRHMAAQPPQVGYTAGQLADAVAREVIR